MKKPRDIRIKYQAQDLKFDAQLISKVEAKRLALWCERVYRWKIKKK